MKIETGIYTGSVRHTRVKPHRLALHHRCFWLALDIDTIDDVTRSQPLLSHNRFNILSLYDSDHGDPGDGSLRQKVEGLLTGAGFEKTPERIVLFCMPRVLGYGFNPISLFICHDQAGQAFAIIYDVHNTFNQRHCYIAPVGKGTQHTEQSADKTFYVSPFMDMDLTYAFEVHATPEQFLLSITARDTKEAVLFTSLNGNRHDLTGSSLARTWLRHPLMTFKVIGAIHFHAVRLWSKGIKLRARPSPPTEPATLGQAGSLKQ